MTERVEANAGMEAANSGQSLDQDQDAPARSAKSQALRAFWLRLKEVPWLTHCQETVPRQLLHHYSEGTGEDFIIPAEEMGNVFHGLGDPQQVWEAGLQILGDRDSAAGNIDLNMQVNSRLACSLGRFTIHLRGNLVGMRSGGKTSFMFQGTMSFYDIWDFDPKPDGSRGPKAERMVRIANRFLAGKPFTVRSAEVPVHAHLTEEEPVLRLEFDGRKESPGTDSEYQVEES